VNTARWYPESIASHAPVERQAPRRGEDAVRPDHGVEPPEPRLLEGDLDAVGELLERRDAVVEDVLHAVGGVHDDAHEVAAQDLDVGDHAARVAEHLGRQLDPAPSGGVEVGDPPHAGVGGAHLVRDAHPVQDGPGRAAHVDALPAGPRAGRTLDHRHVEAVAAEPEGEGGSGDAGAGDEYVGHGCSLISSGARVDVSYTVRSALCWAKSQVVQRIVHHPDHQDGAPGALPERRVVH